MQIKDIKILFFLVLLSVFLRLPFTSKVLYCWDSVQFALATENYNVSLYQPHPPGYFLYVVLAKLLNYIFNDINFTLNFISILFSTLSVAFLFLLAKRMYNTSIAIVSSLFLMTSPILWFSSEVSLPYTAECFFSVLVAYFCFLSLQDEKYILYSTIFLGIAFGVRQNLILFLLPLWIYSATYKLQIKKLFLYLFVLVLVCLASFIPMIYLSGGIKPYFSALSVQTSYVFQFSVFVKGFPALIDNTTDVLTSVFFGGLCAASFILIPYFYKIKTSPFTVHGSHFMIFLLWILPSFLFYCFVFIDPPAYTLTFLPAIFIIFAVMLEKVAITVEKISCNKFSKNIIMLFFLFLIVSINSVIFVLNFPPVIEKNNANWNTKQKIIQKYFSPQNTIILTSFKREKHIPNYFRHFMYYMSRYKTLFLPEIEGIKHKTALLAHSKKIYNLSYKRKNDKFLVEIPDNVNYIVIGDDYLKKYYKYELNNYGKVYFIKKDKKYLVFKKHLFWQDDNDKL